MGLKLVAALSVAATVATVGGYLALKESGRYQYDTRIESAVLRHAELVYRRTGSAPAGFEEYQVTHLLVLVPGTSTASEGASVLASALRKEGWSLDEDPKDGYIGKPSDGAVAVVVDDFAAYERTVLSDPTGEIADLRRHASDRRVVIVTLEAQG